MIYYITYTQNSAPKSATVKEARYRQLLNDSSVANLQTYANSQQLKEATGQGSGKRMLHG